jgi:hypothetical protein
MYFNFPGFVNVMFDDNWTYPFGDNLSLKIACELDLGRISALQSMYTDNFGKIKRPLTDNDMQMIGDMFERSIDTYFEFPFPWRVNDYEGNVLFPEYDWQQIKMVYNVTNSYTEHNNGATVKEMGYGNVCFVKLFLK